MKVSLQREENSSKVELHFTNFFHNTDGSFEAGSRDMKMETGNVRMYLHPKNHAGIGEIDIVLTKVELKKLYKKIGEILELNV